MYQYDQKPATKLSDESQIFLERIKSSEYAVLVGRNNCGKSYLLKTLTQHWGKDAAYLGPARYQNFNLIGYYTPTQNKKDQRWRQFFEQWSKQQQNVDNSPINLQQSIAELSDAKRETLREIIKSLLGVDLEIKLTIPTNSMSQKYVSCGGHNISFTSSGFRLITTLVTSLLDSDYKKFLIDEPELGISPEAQGVLADFLFDRKRREKYFPHVETIVFATHSTIFLDRARLANNYVVSKQGDEISVKPVSSPGEFNGIHFFLLGNRFETLYLPSAIVLVEGKCDLKLVDRILSVKRPDARVSVISANSDSRIKEVLNTVKGIFSDIQRSPYRDRIFVILDSTHTAGLEDALVAMGLPRENIVVWSKNGIEYVYPASIMDAIFGHGGEISIKGDSVERNGISYPKAELADRVVSLLRPETELSGEFIERFWGPLCAKLG